MYLSCDAYTVELHIYQTPFYFFTHLPQFTDMHVYGGKFKNI